MNKNAEIDKLMKLYELPLGELVEMSAKVTSENFEKEVEFCSIISAKTGKCEENCKYCSQSSHNKAKIHAHPLLEVEEVKKAALSAKENGATRFCVVTSGRLPSDEDFEKILCMIREVDKIDGLHACCSLGILNEEQVKKIKEAGAERYNHNLNTAESYHGEICTTHDFRDRVNTIKLIQKHGIEACAGGIIGMGETRRQRVELAVELAQLNPTSVPINFLNPIEGTPLENMKTEINEEEILKTICVFRIAMPKALLRYAGGRTTRFSQEYQKLGIEAGINALLVGNYLTTTGSTPQQDVEFIADTGMTVKK
jgi:biotin synthase